MKWWFKCPSVCLSVCRVPRSNSTMERHRSPKSARWKQITHINPRTYLEVERSKVKVTRPTNAEKMWHTETGGNSTPSSPLGYWWVCDWSGVLNVENLAIVIDHISSRRSGVWYTGFNWSTSQVEPILYIVLSRGVSRVQTFIVGGH